MYLSLIALQVCFGASYSAVTALGPRATGNPSLKSATAMGVALDPSLNRDSCGSVAWAGRILWVCRDTQMVFPNGTVNQADGLWSSSASFSNMTAQGPKFEPVPADGTVPGNEDFEEELVLYGGGYRTPFYVLSEKFCGDNSAGRCPNGSRYPEWPDSPPLVASQQDGNITAYTWIKNTLEDNLEVLIPDPSTALRRVTWSSSTEGANTGNLPQTQFVNSTFFSVGRFSYGAAGSLLFNDTAYLWAQNSLGNTSLARVAVADIEKVDQYQYYVSGKWTHTMPTSANSTDAYLDCTEGGQGTFYYSEAWSCFVWIGGQQHQIDGEVYVSTAPAPEGPWTSPSNIFTVPAGNATLPRYSIQAHPDLIVNKSSSDVYLSYTKQNTNGYQTPLYLLEWNPY